MVISSENGFDIWSLANGNLDKQVKTEFSHPSLHHHARLKITTENTFNNNYIITGYPEKEGSDQPNIFSIKEGQDQLVLNRNRTYLITAIAIAGNEVILGTENNTIEAWRFAIPLTGES